MPAMPRRATIVSIDLLAVLAAAAVAVHRFRKMHRHLAPEAAPSFAHPDPTGADGWWNWWDQGRYLAAAEAWAHGALDPPRHWYLPGYPLLAAPFVALIPTDPFFLPDLAAFLLALFCLAGLGRRLIGAGRWSVPLAVLAFGAVAAGPPVLLHDWVVPWSTTAEAAFFLLALFLATGLGDARASGVRAFAAGLAAGAVAGLRPVDGVVAGLAVAAAAIALPPASTRARATLAAFGGMAVAVAPLAGAYLAVWGPHASPYVRMSGAIGFEWRLLPVRAIALLVDPGPLLPGGRGLLAAFPVAAVGVAGMFASVIGRGATVHRIVVGAALADLAMFLCYRDLHPTGLWRFELHHYFKVPLLLLALYAARFAVLLLRLDRRCVAGAAAALLLGCHHLVLENRGTLPMTADGVDLPGGLAPLDTVVLLPGTDANGTLVATVTGDAGGLVLRNGVDVVAYDAGDALRLLPLRPLPRMMTRLHIQARLDPTQPATLTRIHISWGLGPKAPAGSRGGAPASGASE